MNKVEKHGIIIIDLVYKCNIVILVYYCGVGKICFSLLSIVVTNMFQEEFKCTFLLYMLIDCPPGCPLVLLNKIQKALLLGVYALITA